MSKNAPIVELVRLQGTFAPGAARDKERLLKEIADRARWSARDLKSLHDALCFLRAYPDDARVRRAAEEVTGRLRGWFIAADFDPDSRPLVNTGFPGSASGGEFSLPLLQRLRRSLPDSFEIDWFAIEQDEQLLNALSLLVTSGECQGLDDISIGITDWFGICRPEEQATDLGFLMDLLERAPLDAAVRDVLFDTCALPIRFALSEPGTGRAEIVREVKRVHYQRGELDRSPHSMGSVMRRPLPRPQRLSPKAGEEMIQIGQRALCARGLEIRTLSYANAGDVTIATCGRGLEIAVIGVVPRYRDPLESHYCCFVLKNGVPIGYGPSTVSFGCCELGLNLFPEFRGAEIKFIYPQFTRVLHQVLGAQYFFLTAYGMGEGNPAAIRTGAFWFYRKLGFRPTNPKVEEIAREEEQHMVEDPRHRSSLTTLRRLSHTSVYFDLSSGACRPLDHGGIGLRQSRFIAERFGAERGKARTACVRELTQVLECSDLGGASPGIRRAWEILAPLLMRIPGLAQWSSTDRKRLRRILDDKGGNSELGVDTAMRSHPRLVRAVQEL